MIVFRILLHARRKESVHDALFTPAFSFEDLETGERFEGTKRSSHASGDQMDCRDEDDDNDDDDDDDDDDAEDSNEDESGQKARLKRIERKEAFKKQFRGGLEDDDDTNGASFEEVKVRLSSMRVGAVVFKLYS